MSRGEAKRRFTLADHRDATEGVECRKDREVIDETPMAYKDIDAVMAAQARSRRRRPHVEAGGVREGLTDRAEAAGGADRRVLRTGPCDGAARVGYLADACRSKPLRITDPDDVMPRTPIDRQAATVAAAIDSPSPGPSSLVHGDLLPSQPAPKDARRHAPAACPSAATARSPRATA